jgi:hypothetical protein
MNPINNAWFIPTVIVAALGVTVQGIKAGWDLVMSLKSHRNSQNSLRLQELGALMNLVAGLPLAEARKVVWKVKLVRLIQQKAPISDVYSTLDNLTVEVVGAHTSASPGSSAASR